MKSKKELIELGYLPKKNNWCRLFDKGFVYKICGNWTAKDYDGNILCENVDWCNLEENGFEYRINEKYTAKDYEGNILFENVDYCWLYEKDFEYRVDGETFTKKYEDINKNNKGIENIENIENTIEISASDADTFKVSHHKLLVNENTCLLDVIRYFKDKGSCSIELDLKYFVKEKFINFKK